MPTRIKIAALMLSSVGMISAISGCSSNSSSTDSASQVQTSKDVSAEGTATSTETANYNVPANVLADYFKAICEGPGTKLGMGGKYDASTATCTDSNGTATTQDSGLSGLLSSTPDQMLTSIQMMVVQVGEPVADCPTAEEFNTVTDLTITDTCVEHALVAMTKYMQS